MKRAEEAERIARLVLSRLAEPGDAEICLATAREGPVQVLRDLLRGGSDKQAKQRDLAARIRTARPERDLEAADRLGARFVVPGDEEWPMRLADLIYVPPKDGRGGPPLGLWVRGSWQLAELVERSIAIVGARAATSYGEFVAGEIAVDCANAGFTVVSGGAFGIDAAGHRGALAVRKPTVAVLAGGVDKLYPPRNTLLLERIVDEGLVVSEAAPGCSPSRTRFLSRNRLIAALSGGVLVVEAALRSGSLSTARWARELNRPVMGVPGPVTSYASAGVHQLLRQPESTLVTDGAEVVEHISPVGVALAPAKAGPVSARDSLQVRSRQVLDAVPKLRPSPTPAIARTAGLPEAEVESRLRELAESKLVVQSSRGWRLLDL